MATPDIGTTISEGYSRGFERLGPIAGAVVVPALIAGAVTFACTYVQAQLLSDSAEDLARTLLSGGDLDLGRGDLAIYNLLSVVQTVVFSVVLFGSMALVAGALHRERHGAALELPGPAASVGATVAAFQALMPKAGFLILLSVLGTIVSIVSLTLGSLVSIVAALVTIWLSIRWAYAFVIAGAGEQTNDAAYARSDEAVRGSWWPTFGIFIVVGLATILPIGIAAAIVGAILGAVMTELASFAMFTILVIGFAAILGAATESAWSQVEAKLGAGDGTLPPPPAGTDPTPGTPPTEPPASGPFV